MYYLEEEYEVRSNLDGLLSHNIDSWNSSGSDLMNGALTMTSQYGGGFSSLNSLGCSEPLQLSEESDESREMCDADKAQLTELTPVKNINSLHQAYSRQTGNFRFQEIDGNGNNYWAEENYDNVLISSSANNINCPGMEYEYPDSIIFRDAVTPGAESTLNVSPLHESLEPTQCFGEYQELMTVMESAQFPRLEDLSTTDNSSHQFQTDNTSQQFQGHQLQEPQEFDTQYMENPSPPSYVLSSPNCYSPYYDNSNFNDGTEHDLVNQTTSSPSPPPINNSCIGDFNINRGIKYWLREITVGKNNRPRGPRCWEFLLRLLNDSSSNPSLIKWEDESVGSFRLVEKEKIAVIWGMRQSKKKRKSIKYESFARILRYHYKNGMVQPVSEKHLVYKFCGKVMRDFHSGKIL